MASITLRSYNREIEGMIDHGQTDEAIAHCMHILQFVPKHIGTYRLLGKAFLESRRYSEATDIFQRVLSSVPDDFVANIGMSIIREDEKNLDSAIWHMERAFEAQPSNAAIQDELRRLYGRRDGMEPPKVRLTRGALSRMYFKGNLFNQAIGELRAALSEDPQRTDLQVLLAQAYYANGQQTEAADTCNAIIKKLPYCQEANRILAAILPDTDQALNAKEYQQRLVSLDPYYGSISPKASSSEEVPEKAVVVERLDYKPGAPEEAPSQPAWASSLGVNLEPEQESLPEWLSSDENMQPVSPESPIEEEQGVGSEETSPETEAQIPDWMKEAGWEASTGPEQAPEPLENIDETPQAEGEIVPGEMPDWLREIAPSGALDQEPEITEGLNPEEEVLPWLQETQPGASDSVISWLDKQQPEGAPPEEPVSEPTSGEEAELPAWMSGFNEEAEKASTPPAEELPEWIQETQGTQDTSSGVTDWLSNMGAEASASESEQAPVEEPEEWMQPTGDEQLLSDEVASEGLSLESPSPSEEVPDWLKEIEAEAEETPPTVVPSEQITPSEIAQASEPASEEEIPDWLQAIEDKTHIEPELTVISPTEEVPETPPEAFDEASSLAWLEALARKQGVPEDQLTTSPGEKPVEIPSGILEPAEETPEEPPVEEIELAAVEPTITEEIESDKQLEAVAPEEETPDWLTALAGAALASELIQPTEEEEVQPAVPSEETPDWLKSVGAESPVEEEPTLLAPAEGEMTIPPEEMDQDTAMAWLESLAAKSAEPEGQPTVQPEEAEEAIEETAPWVLETPVESEQLETESVSEPEKDEVVFPDWLIEATETETSQEPVQPEEAIPEWLSGVESEAPLEAALEESESVLEEESPAEALEPFTSEAPPIEEVGEVTEEAPHEEALAWLETLARKQGVPEEQLVTHPLEPVEEPPGWVQEEVEAAEGLEETQPTLVEKEPEEVPAEVSELEVSAEELELATSLETAEPVPEEELTVASEVEEEAVPVEMEAAVPTDETLPSWLVEETVPSTLPETEEETPPAEIEPVQKLNINAATLTELEALPGIGFTLAQAIINYREEHGDFLSLDEIEQVSGVGQERVDGIKDLVEVVPSWGATKYVEEVSLPQGEDKEILTQGRNAIVQENVPAAVDFFSTLVNKRVYLAEIITELAQVLKEHPDNLPGWQTLGDAYVRNDQLQEALAAYIKAEELIS
jgi:comEA protein